MTRPILYSFRRCPYAMRARLAIAASEVEVELREILLRDKAPDFLEASPKGTVPVVVDGATVIEESLDVMHWALAQNDPEGWLEMPAMGNDLIALSDGPFKAALDHTKYHSRYPDLNRDEERAKAGEFLLQLDRQLDGKPWLFGNTPKLADYAILPFVRQFANIDRPWFDAQPWPNVIAWLDQFLVSPQFQAIMAKYAKWVKADPVTVFPA